MDERGTREGVRALGPSLMEDTIVQEMAPTGDGIRGDEDTPFESSSSDLPASTVHQTHSDLSNRAREILDVIVVEMGPPPTESTPTIQSPPPIPCPSPRNITQAVSIPHPAYKTPPPSISSRANTPPTPVIPSSPTVRSVFKPRIPSVTPSTARDTPRQIGTTPLHPVDLDLLTLAHKFDLSDEAVVAAKHIVLRYESKISRPQLAVIARAALFAACRQVGIARTFNEFDSNLDNNKKVLWHKTFKAIDGLLKMDAQKKDALTKDTNKNASTGTNNQSASPASTIPISFRVTDFINSESKSLSLSPKIRSRALAISEHPVIESLFSGKRPSATAAIILSFAAECEDYYIGSAPYAEAAKVSTQAVVAGQKRLLRCVEEMAGRGQLPRPFRARWNTRGYRDECEGEE